MDQNLPNYSLFNKYLGFLMLGILVLNPGCGVTVGNSGRPLVALPDAQLASLVSLQHDEVLDSVLDQNAQGASASVVTLERVNTNQSLSLLAGEEALKFVEPEVALSCSEVLASGGISIVREDKGSKEFEAGRVGKQRLFTHTIDSRRQITLTPPSPTPAMKCNARGRPELTWAQLIGLKSSETLVKTRQQKVVLKADNSVLRQNELKLSSKRENQFSKVAVSLESLTLRKTSSFESSVELQKTGEVEALKRAIKTLVDEPLILEKTLTKSAGITSVKIVSGAVLSIDDSEKSIVLRYKDLILGTGLSCHPSSGTIAGEVYSDSSATKAESSFVIEYTSEGAMLQHSDGSEEDLDFEPCKS